MSNIYQLANSFVDYFKNFNTKNIPESFIKEYYILSHQQYISLTEFTKWIDINRKTIIENLQKNYKLNEDYFITTQSDEFQNIILYKNLDYKHNQKFIKITSKCFKDICVRSNSNKGNLMRKYYTELDELFKKFHIDTIQDVSNENKILLNNQSKNKLKNEEGLYIWYEDKQDLKYRIGKATNVYERIAIHNSSNENKIFPVIIVYSKCMLDIENMLKIGLRKYSYRGEFYKCSIKILNQTVQDVINFLNKYNKECNIKKEHIVKFNYNKSVLNKNKNTKLPSKKLSKKNSKKSKKII